MRSTLPEAPAEASAVVRTRVRGVMRKRVQGEARTRGRERGGAVLTMSAARRTERFGSVSDRRREGCRAEEARLRRGSTGAHHRQAIEWRSVLKALTAQVRSTLPEARAAALAVVRTA